MSLARVDSRVVNLLRRHYRARQLGIPYKRSRDFRLPRQLRLNGAMQEIRAPDEVGMQVAFHNIFLDDSYGIRQIGFPVRTVLDIGGNVGFFGLCARTVFPNATIHVYEPNRDLLPYLENQAKLGSFQFFMEAVGLEAGTVSMVSGSESVTGRVTADAAGTVPLIPFREAIARLGGQVDILKLDCEGGEWPILRDAEAFRNVRYLGMEYHLIDGHTVDELLSTLSGMGFRPLFVERHDAPYGMLTAIRESP